jgi:hypothetical protein
MRGGRGSGEGGDPLEREQSPGQGGLELKAHVLPELFGWTVFGSGDSGVLMMTPDEIESARKRYHEKRRRWARSIGIPYSEDLEKPEPGVVADLVEDEG